MQFKIVGSVSIQDSLQSQQTFIPVSGIPVGYTEVGGRSLSDVRCRVYRISVFGIQYKAQKLGVEQFDVGVKFIDSGHPTANIIGAGGYFLYRQRIKRYSKAVYPTKLRRRIFDSEKKTV